jgi:hypothetical protein
VQYPIFLSKEEVSIMSSIYMNETVWITEGKTFPP